MNNTMKRRLYMAPAAELICLAPNTSIASWEYKDGGRSWKNSWRADDVPEDLFNLASATGFATWIGEDELK